MARRVCIVHSIKDDPGNGARVEAPQHGLLEGSRITFQGVSGQTEHLGVSSFIVERLDGTDAFWIAREVRVPIARIDAEAGVIETCKPHGLRKWAHSVSLAHVKGDGADLVNNKSFEVISLDKCHVSLGEYREVEPQRLQKMPVRFPPSLSAGLLLSEPQGVDLSLAKFPLLGGEVWTGPSAASYFECLADWRAALNASSIKLQRNLTCEVVDQMPEALVVNRGGSGCAGQYVQHRPTEYSCGVSHVKFVRDLGLWCLIADLVPTYPLRNRRRQLGLTSKWEGPQLLYVCTGATPNGSWEPVLGNYPAPIVRTSSCGTMKIDSCVFPSLKSPHWTTEFGAMLMLVLFSIEPRRENHWIFRIVTALDAARFLLADVGTDLCAAAVVCKAWHSSLRGRDTSAIKVALQPFKNVRQSQPAALREAARLLALGFCRTCLRSPDLASFDVLEDPCFCKFSWSSVLDDVVVSAPLPAEFRTPSGPVAEFLETLAPVISATVKCMFGDLQVAWSHESQANGISHTSRGRQCDCFLVDNLFCSLDLHDHPQFLCRGVEEEYRIGCQFLNFNAEEILSPNGLDDYVGRLQTHVREVMPGVTLTSDGYVGDWSLHRTAWDEIEGLRCESCTSTTLWHNLCRECKRRHACARTQLIATKHIRFIVQGGTVPEFSLAVRAACLPLRVTGKDTRSSFEDIAGYFPDLEEEEEEETEEHDDDDEEENEDGQ